MSRGNFWGSGHAHYLDLVTISQINTNVNIYHIIHFILIVSTYKHTHKAFFINNFMVFHGVYDHIVIFLTASQLIDISLVSNASLP